MQRLPFKFYFQEHHILSIKKKAEHFSIKFRKSCQETEFDVYIAFRIEIFFEIGSITKSSLGDGRNHSLKLFPFHFYIPNLTLKWLLRYL